MLTTLIIVSLFYIWLAYETDWFRVRLLVGAIAPKDKRQWQFAKYGDDALKLCQQCRNKCNRKLPDGEKWFGWELPARTVKVFGSTINFKAGCNLYRAKLLKDIVKAQNNKALPTYKGQVTAPAYYHCTPEPTMELLVNGKSVANINGDYKRGAIRQLVRSYK